MIGKVSPGKRNSEETAVPQGGRMPFFQPKLTIGSPDDPYELEADRVADQVMRKTVPNRSGPLFFNGSPVSIRRKCKHCEEEEKKRIHRKKTAGPEGTADVGFERYVSSLEGRGTALPSAERDFFESRFGYDFSAVRIHTGQEAARSAQQISALAFTAGNHIVFDVGQYRPGSESGRRLLAHELTHVVQQQGEPRAIQRQTARSVGSNEVEVEHEGERYRVRRTGGGDSEGGTSGSVDTHVDHTNMAIRINICHDRMQGAIELGADIPEQARDIAQRILGAVTRGEVQRIPDILSDVDITPFLEILFARSREFRLTARGAVTVGIDGVHGGRGTLGLDLGSVRLSVEGYGNEEGWGVGGIMQIMPGRTSEAVTCVTVPLPVQLACERWYPESTIEEERSVTYVDVQQRFIYFDYAQSTIDQTRSARMLAEITALLQDGYRVTGITGHTSPEGPMQRGRRFEGNERLAQNRAAAALREIESICTSHGLTDGGGTCAVNVTREVQPIGLGELYTLIDASGGEVEGNMLAQHAVDQFRTADAETAHRTDELLRQLDTMTPEQQRDMVYPLLRRATITLEKSSTRPERVSQTEPARYREVSCPPAVEAAARVQFMLR